MKAILLILSLLAAAAAPGCASSPPPPGAGVLAIAPGEYAATFDAAREELRNLGFLMERVDAREGVILTKPLESIGLAAPWDRAQSAAYQEFEDMMHRQRRQVRITFEPAEAPAAKQLDHSAPSMPAPDLRDHDGATTMRIHAVILRVHRPGWKPDSTALTHSSSYWWDADLASRGMQPESVVPFREDTPLEERLVEKILRRLD